MNILIVTASARYRGSLSRTLADRFADTWRERRENDPILWRDTADGSIPHVTQGWITAAFTPEADRTAQHHRTLALSDEFIGEARWADIIVLATPMYNYGMPSTLKAWFDHVIRINETFTFDLARGDFPLESTLSGKTLVLLTSSGEFGFAPGGIREHAGHLASHARTCAGYLGVETTHHVAIEYQEFDDERHRASVDRALEDVAVLASHLTEQNTAWTGVEHHA